MRIVKILTVTVFGILSLTMLIAAAQKKTPHGVPNVFRNNNCVTCHAGIKEPVGTSAHFYEWRNSRHANQAVGCEKCHGGNPNTDSYKLAHEGVLSPTFTQSTLHPKNLAQTCSTCHQEIANAFVKSRHSQVLQESGNGPSCTNCHRHMASSVTNWPPDTSMLCAQCHKPNGSGAKFMNVPTQAGETIAAFTRSDGVLEWARYLLAECKKQKVLLPLETKKIRQLEIVNKQAKVQWHEFNLTASRRTVDDVFLRATEVKDGIWKKLPE
jgi:Cytochrome c554 and c-prime